MEQKLGFRKEGRDYQNFFFGNPFFFFFFAEDHSAEKRDTFFLGGAKKGSITHISINQTQPKTSCFTFLSVCAFSPSTPVRMANKLQLEDVIGDENLSSSFLTFLRASYMSVSYELWLEIVKYETVCKTDEARRETYRHVMKRFFEKGCPDPMSLPKLITHSITKYHADIDDEKKPLPQHLFNQSKEELWMLLCWTCLPAFQLSEAYKDFETGKVDSEKTGFSRNKAEKFFGQTINGPLTRAEIVTHYGSSRNATYGEQKLRLKAELDYQQHKRMDMVDVMKQARKGGLFQRVDLDVIAERKGMGGSEGSSKSSDKGSSSSKSKYTKSSSGKKKKVTKFHPIYGEIEVEVSDDEGELIDDLGTSNTDLTMMESGCAKCGSARHKQQLGQCRLCGEKFCPDCQRLPPSKNKCSADKSGHNFEPLKVKEGKPGTAGQAVGLWEMFE